MFIQTQNTPNPNSLKFLPGKTVSEDGPYEILNKDQTNNNLLRNILSINGVTGMFLGEDFLSVNKKNGPNKIFEPFNLIYLDLKRSFKCYSKC